jgi:plastocyanin
MKRKSEVCAIWAVTVLLLAVCASFQPQVALSEESSEKVVELKADSFKFEPNNIKISEGETVLFRIENISNSTHNFTIKDPQKQILKSEALPAKKTTDIKVSFAEPGVYEFYCDKPFHSSFGMKGQVEVAKKVTDPSK